MNDVIFAVVDVAEIIEFRRAMLWPDKPLSHVMLPEDDTATHICGRLGQAIVAAGSFFIVGQTAQLRKLAIDPAYRGRQLGKVLVMHGARIMSDKGARVLWCDARVESVGFYKRLGFEIEIPEYEKSGARYRKASLNLI